MDVPGRVARSRVADGAERGAARTVLVVDAVPDVRDVLTEFLARLGLIAVPVPAGEHAELMCEKLELDLILLGRLPPAEPAGTLVERLRARRPGAPVVIVGDAAGDPGALRADGDGPAVACPLDLSRLRDVLAELLDLSALGARRRPGSGRRAAAAACAARITAGAHVRRVATVERPAAGSVSRGEGQRLGVERLGLLPEADVAGGGEQSRLGVRDPARDLP